jgi:hypothetical protein
VFGLAVVFAIVDSYDLHRAASPSPFALPEGIVLICGAAFAGYLSIWGDNPVSVLLLAMLGWFLFRKAMITAPEPSLQRPDGPVAERLIRFREEAQLLDGRRKSAERDYMERKINDTDLGAEMKRLDELGAASGATLGMTPEQAKFWTLNFGPGASPLRNAMIGAAGGVVAAILMQILVVLTRAPEKAELPVWLSLAGTMVGDFRHSIVSGEGSVSLVLSLVSAVLNAFAFWVILGFIFGMVFHRLRGTDGFTKALTFSAGMAVPFLVSQVLAGPGEGIGLYRLLGLVPVIVVLLVLGVVVFDGFSLRRQDVSPRALPDIYGVNTSIGYASLVGAIASIQPIFQLAGRLFKKPSGK